MKKKHWPARDPVKNYFPLPNELYSLGLSSTAIAIYGYLLRIEDRQTYQCLASYSKIGKAIGRSVNTVRKYVTELEERSLIRTERTTIITQDGRKQNGCLRYTTLYHVNHSFAVQGLHRRKLCEVGNPAVSFTPVLQNISQLFL